MSLPSENHSWLHPPEQKNRQYRCDQGYGPLGVPYRSGPCDHRRSRYDPQPQKVVRWQVDADAGHDAFFQRVLVDRDAARAEMPGRVDMGAAMIRHRDEHRRQPIDVSRIGKRLLVVLPHAVDDRRMTGIARGAMIEFAAEVDDFHRVGL